MTQAPAPQQPSSFKPHRGVLILVLGILGIFICFILGIVAWVMGNNDLREMEAGRMDPSGEGMTKWGKILGIIGVVLQILFVLFYILVFVILAARVASQAGAGG